MMRASHWLILLGLLLAGCGPQRGTVSGLVTLNGQPLEKGVISFNAPNDAAGSATAEIVAGKYAVDLMVGTKQVQISSPIVTGMRPEYAGPGAPLVEITEERLPPRYHSESDLTFEVKPGKNDKNWDLQADPPRR